MNVNEDISNKVNSVEIKNRKGQNTICIENSEPKY